MRRADDSLGHHIKASYTQLDIRSHNTSAAQASHYQDSLQDDERQFIKAGSLPCPSIEHTIQVKFGIVQNDSFESYSPSYSPPVTRSQAIGKRKRDSAVISNVSKRMKVDNLTNSTNQELNISSSTPDSKPQKKRSAHQPYDYSNNEESTALSRKIILSIKLGRTDILRSLARQMPNTLLEFRTHSFNYTIFHLAARNNNVIALKIALNLIQNDTQRIYLINAQSKNKDSSIQIASAYSGASLIELLIAKGARVDCKSLQNGNLLHIACKHENCEAVKFLAANYPFMIHEQLGKYKRIPLFNTLANRSVHCFNAIIEAGITVHSITDAMLCTLLHFCCALGNTTHLPLLIEKIQNEIKGMPYLISKDMLGNTPLDLACIKTDKDFISILLKLLPDGVITIASLKSAISKATKNCNTDVIGILEVEIKKLDQNQGIITLE